MDHFYKNIEGWFDFYDIYSLMVNKAKDGAHFVEVGTYVGCSAAYMAVEIANSGKNIKFDCIDDVDVSLINLNLAPVKNYFNAIKGKGLKVAENYLPNSLDFVFLDHGPTFNDIECWKTKVKKGGYLGGHDFNDDFIKESVDLLLPGYEIYDGARDPSKSSWVNWRFNEGGKRITLDHNSRLSYLWQKK